MYVKPANRQIRGVYVPDNYNGTAFTEPAPEPEQTVPDQTEPQAPPQEVVAVTEAVPASKTEDKGLFPSLFSGLRSDDLLLLALILLMSRNDDQGGHSTSEILPLLAILLFMG